MLEKTIAGATVSVEMEHYNPATGRLDYRWRITLPDGSYHSCCDLSSRVGADEDEEEMFRTLCGFLSACGESWPDGENADLFPRSVAIWAKMSSDEVALESMELEE